MADIATLQGDLEALKAARRSGALTVKIGDRSVTYRSDNELQAAIAATEAELGTSRPSNVVIRPIRGW